MARRAAKPQGRSEEPQPIDRMGRRPWWAEPLSDERRAAHERARCLRARGHAAIQWDRTHGEIQTELDW
jgi:hypothetical protein